MGLAASQARFLCITSRKANCEFKSTQLAQQKYEISQKLADISSEYANSMNATKLVWDNDSLDNVYGLTYSLLMMPSDANDYNPYFVTTSSGAIVLNDKYAKAAIEAGISKGGGTPSASGREDFIKELGVQGIVTKTTGELLTKVPWNKAAGLGEAPADKNSVTVATLPDLITKQSIGGQEIDWVALAQPELSGRTVTAYKNQVAANNNDVQTQRTKAQQNNTQINIPFDSLEIKEKGADNKEQVVRTYYQGNIASFNDISEAYIEKINEDMKTYEGKYTYSDKPDANGNYTATYSKDWENSTTYKLFGKYLEEIDEQDKIIATYSPKVNTGGFAERREASQKVAEANVKKKNIQAELDQNKQAYPLYWAMFNAYKFTVDNKDQRVEWGDVINKDTGKTLNFSDYFRTNSAQTNYGTISVITNGSFNFNASSLQDMTIGDLMADDVVITTYANGWDNATRKMADYGQTILDQVASVLGYGRPETALNVDSASNDALEYAYYMTQRTFLKYQNSERRWNMGSTTDPAQNNAWIGSQKYNRICTNYDSNTGSECAALNLSNMVSAFLTFYDQSLRGAQSVYDGYNVGRGIDSNESSKTYFVTDNPYYSYILETTQVLTTEQKMADFYDQLYNNLCFYGWRQDDSVDHTDYLDSAIKDGRFSMMSLNNDGYFYQTRYNNTGYLVEVQDEDAITRAEIEYTRQKAELTTKEDSIDIKTKNLDAEIAELNTELEAVKQLVSNNVQKTFAMYQQ